MSTLYERCACGAEFRTGDAYKEAREQLKDFRDRHAACLAVPVQQEPEGWSPAEAERVIRKLGFGTDMIDGVALTVVEARALADRLSAPVPSVGLRDRVACELANLEYERSGRLCETEDFYADADRVLSVLHEAGTQDSWATFGEDMTLQREVAALNVQLVDLAESLQKAVERHQSNLRFRAEQLQDKAEAGTQELTEADRPYCPDCGMRYDEDCADCDVGDDFRAQNARFASSAEAGTQEDEREVLRVVQDDNGYVVIRDGEWARADDPALLENYVVQVLYEARTFKFTGPAPAVSGSPDTKEDA